MDTYGDALYGAAPVTQAALDAQTAALTATMAAHMSVDSARRFNAMVLRYTHPLNVNTEFRRLPKVTAGRGGDGNINIAGIPANPEDVGTVCPGVLFPRDDATLRVLTVAQIDALSTWFNHDFGIVAGDDDEGRREKFRGYIQWG